MNTGYGRLLLKLLSLALVVAELTCFMRTSPAAWGRASSS